MKRFFLTLVLLSFAIGLFAKSQFISYKDFKIDGLYLNSNKNDVIKVFGNPQKIYEPGYECGFFSEYQQRKKFYSLKYTSLIFTGNDTEDYQLEKVYFNNKMNFKITYKEKLLSHKTTISEFEAIFGIKVTENEASLSEENAETKLQFRFINGVLAEMEYWTPC